MKRLLSPCLVWRPEPQLTQPAHTRVQTLTLWGQAQPLLHEHLHSGQTQPPLAVSLAKRTQRHGEYKDISCLFLVPIKFLQKKTHLQLCVFGLIFVLLSIKSQTVEELLLEGGKPQ